MRKISFGIVLAFLPILNIFSQGNDSTVYKKKQLSIDEVNIVTSYYTQEGNNSAVTGGRGTEALTDFSNQFSIKFKFSPGKKPQNSHNLNLKMGIDYYTSESSDNIDFEPSSDSSSDQRFYPSVDYSFENGEKNYTLGAGLYYSSEYDYQSIGVQANFSKKFNNKNTEYSAQINAFIDQVSEILPEEIRPPNQDDDDYRNVSRNTFSLSQGITQVLSKKNVVGLFLDVVYQEGLLSTPFNRVYFENGGNVSNEKLPSSRIKIPIGIRYNSFLNDKIQLRTFYRFYWDDWGLLANTLELEAPYRLNKLLTLTPYLRLYQQNESKYFREFRQVRQTDQLYTSDYDLSSFTSIMPGLALKIQPENESLFKFLQALQFKYGFYHRDNGLDAHIVTAALTFK